ncbi:hypothetical protein [Rhodoferax sp.]|uniref:hypothetical protein n=1 Tax=Rhodoferax sp. TaxID=50421 RepID=UPI002721465D|nr:hypothetical protein [Rhodoferax sp.]MDO8319686.1 hypothetical protein [Rhodoferax sp.]MDP2678678.1 hypothetical protein [Rhodoferax sp.]
MLVDTEQPSRILGFYTLSAAQVDVLHISDVGSEKAVALSGAVLSDGTTGLQRYAP